MLVVKRVLDMIVASVLLLVTAPLMTVIAVLIKIQSSGAVLFRQEREGRRGRAFRIYKFRSMVPNAEEQGPVLSMKDARITSVGRFLRRTSLDELPQLFNVVLGQMSLVGPRPLKPGTTRPSEIRRLDMRPGMTSLVEVNDAHLLSWDDRMQLDLRYVEGWSLLGDLKILLGTIPVVITRKDILDHPRDLTPTVKEETHLDTEQR